MPYSPNILITGSEGQLAKSLIALARWQGIKLSHLNRKELDISAPSSILRAIIQLKPDVIINTAAYTLVDEAENKKEEAMKINHHGSKYLSQACQQHAISLIHLSTDYIFDGQKTTPYQEEDAPNPINVYGLSKWRGEEAIRNSNCHFIILRISGLFSRYGHNFLKTMHHLFKTKKELHIVDNQVICPTYAMDVAKLIFFLIKHAHYKNQIYHFCSQPAVSWYHFAEAILEAVKKRETPSLCQLYPIKSDQYPTPAKRPPYSVLDCHKIKKDYGILQPSWQKGIEDACHFMEQESC